MPRRTQKRCHVDTNPILAAASLLLFVPGLCAKGLSLSLGISFFLLSLTLPSNPWEGGSTLFPTCLSALRCDLQREARPCEEMRSDAMRCDAGWQHAKEVLLPLLTMLKLRQIACTTQPLTRECRLRPYTTTYVYSLNMQSSHHQHHQGPPGPQRTHVFTTNSCTTRLVLRVPVDLLPHSAILWPFLRDTKN